jgi:hypothetical protein
VVNSRESLEAAAPAYATHLLDDEDCKSQCGRLMPDWHAHEPSIRTSRQASHSSWDAATLTLNAGLCAPADEAMALFCLYDT